MMSFKNKYIINRIFVGAFLYELPIRGIVITRLKSKTPITDHVNNKHVFDCIINYKEIIFSDGLGLKKIMSFTPIYQLLIRDAYDDVNIDGGIVL